MHTIAKRVLVTGVAAMLTAISAMALPVTFAQYTQTSSAQQWTLTNTLTTSTISASGQAYFIYQVAGTPFGGPELSNFTLTTTSNQPGNCGVNCGAGDSYVQPGYTGTFKFTDVALGTNLLSGTFSVNPATPATTGAQVSSSIGGTGGSFSASQTAGNLNQVVFASDYVSFAANSSETATFSLSSLIPSFSVGTVVGNQAYPNSSGFNAAGSGTFSTAIAPITQTPEPATFALLGLSLVGLGLYRAKRTA
jgi:hypothetical protein